MVGSGIVAGQGAGWRAGWGAGWRSWTKAKRDGYIELILLSARRPLPAARDVQLGARRADGEDDGRVGGAGPGRLPCVVQRCPRDGRGPWRLSPACRLDRRLFAPVRTSHTADLHAGACQEHVWATRGLRLHQSPRLLGSLLDPTLLPAVPLIVPTWSALPCFSRPVSNRPSRPVQAFLRLVALTSIVSDVSLSSHHCYPEYRQPVVDAPQTFGPRTGVNIACPVPVRRIEWNINAFSRATRLCLRDAPSSSHWPSRGKPNRTLVL